jgi:Histidine kinase-, DNA gyrase B-, and HSP90-like ATPase
MSTPSIHIPGMMRGKLAAGFSNVHCLMELCDNSESAQAKNIRIYLDTVNKCLVISNDGNGIHGKTGLERAVCFYMDSDPSENHGRYGIGLKYALIQFTQLLEKVTIITCSEKPNYLEKRTIEENRDDRALWQIEVDFPTIMKEETLYFKAQRADRMVEKLWERYAVDKYNTGTVIHIPCEDNVFSELLMMARSSDIKTSLRYHLGITYQNYLKKNNMIHLHIDDTHVNIVRIERLFFDQLPKDDRIEIEFTIYRDQHRDIRVYLMKGKEIGYYVQPNPNINRLKFVSDPPSGEWKPIGKMTLRGGYSNDWISKERASLEANGIALPLMAGIQEIRVILGGTSIERNGKIVSIIPPIKATSGDTARYKYVEDQHWSISYSPVYDNPCIENERIFTLDNLLNIEVNKSRIDVTQIHKNIWITYQMQSKQFADSLYKKKEQQPNCNGVTQFKPKASPSTSVAASAASASAASASAASASAASASAASASAASASAASGAAVSAAPSPSSSSAISSIVPSSTLPASAAAGSVEKKKGPAVAPSESSESSKTKVSSHVRSTPKCPKDIVELFRALHDNYRADELKEISNRATVDTEPRLSSLYNALKEVEDILKRLHDNQ